MTKVVQLQRPREAVRVVETPLPEPGPGEVRVRVEACALGQLDWNLLTLDAPPRLPLVPGHEAVGRVDAVGPNTSLSLGARVLVTALAGSCGTCAACRAGEARRCPEVRWRGMHADGALGTHLVTPASTLAPCPAELPAEQAALLGGSGWTALGAVRALGHEHPARVGVWGVGGVGHLVVQALRALGHVTQPHDVDPTRHAEGLRLAGGAHDGPLDAAVVCTPSTQALQQAVRAVAPGSTVVVCGTSPAGRVDLALSDLVWRGLTLKSCLLGTRADLDDAIALMQRGALRAAVEVHPLAAAPEKLWALRDLGFGGRLVFVP